MPATSPMKKPMADDTAPANAMVIMTASRPAEGCAPNQMIGTIHRPATRAAANHGPQLRASRLTMTDVVLVSESGMKCAFRIRWEGLRRVLVALALAQG